MPKASWAWLLFSFDGRISRATYWRAFLFPYMLLQAGFSVMDSALGTFGPYGVVGQTSSLFALAAVWPYMATATKRWHDRGKSGWWTMVLLIPYVGLVWFAVSCVFRKGMPGPNEYGPDPLGVPGEARYLLTREALGFNRWKRRGAR